MKGLILLDQSDGQSIAAELLIRYYHGKADADVTVKNCSGVTLGNLTTYIGTLDDNTYSKIHVLIVADESGGTGKISLDQVALLYPKLLTAALPTPAKALLAADTNATATEIVLTGTVSATNDHYNGMIAVIDVGGTATSYLYRNIKDYVGATKTLTVNTTTTAVTSTDKVAIYDLIGNGIVLVSAVAVAAYTVFHTLYPDTVLPRVFDEFKEATAEYVLTATADSVATTSGVSTLTDSAAFVLNAYTGGNYYVGIRSSTLGMGQVRKIISNTANVLTLDAPWDPLPTGTIVYEIAIDRWRCLNNYFLRYAMRFEFAAPYTDVKLAKFIRLFDVKGTMTADTRYTFQDLVALEELHDLGETIMVSLGRGITS